MTSFMQPDVQQFAAYQIDTTCGIEIVPTAVVGCHGDSVSPDTLTDYLEGEPLDSDEPAEKVAGWFSRLSAPGYMDCTDWSGPYPTRDAAKAALIEMYGDDDSAE